MVLAKNYETVSKFVKVMPRMLLFLFSGHGVVSLSACFWCCFVTYLYSLQRRITNICYPPLQTDGLCKMLVVVRCVNKDYGAIGCAVDVLSFADSRCSGRSRCTITVADFSLRGIRPCPQDLTSYFEAGYRCVPGKCVNHIR